MLDSVDTDVADPELRHLLAGYAERAAVYDEMLAPDGTVRAHWRTFVEGFARLGADGRAAAADSTRRLLRETRLSAFTGRRAVTQFLAIAPPTQGNPRHGGGVIDFDRAYAGAEARARWAFGPLDLVAGLALETQRDDRRGYENYTGAAPDQLLGVVGTLRRDEVNRAETRDARQGR